jgi:ribosomal protein L7/L12
VNKVVLESEIIDFLKAGKEIEAIKKLQALRGIELAEAEDIIDDYLETDADNNVNINIDDKVDKKKPYDYSVFGSKGEFKKI